MNSLRPCLLLGLLLLAACAASPPPIPASAPTTAAAPSPAAAPGDEPRVFEGCTASPLEGVGWAYSCDGLAATIADMQKADPTALLDGNTHGLRESLQGKIDGKVDEANATYDLAGKHAQGRRVTVTANGAVVIRSDAAVVPVDGAGLRIVTCGGRADARLADRCNALFQSLARAPWRDDAAQGVTVTSDVVALAGRSIDVPKGCNASKQDDGAMIRCDRSPTLFWLENTADPAAERERFLASAGKAGTRGRVACAVDSAAGECDVVTDSTGVAYRGAAQVRGRSVVVYCIAPSKALPAVCAQVLSIGGAR